MDIETTFICMCININVIITSFESVRYLKYNFYKMRSCVLAHLGTQYWQQELPVKLNEKARKLSYFVIVRNQW